MLWVAALIGEEIFDSLQRQMMDDPELQPMVQRLMRIHVTEEARHLSFARQYLRNSVPGLGWLQRQAIAVEAPTILAVMASVMMRPPGTIVREYNIPKAVE